VLGTGLVGWAGLGEGVVDGTVEVGGGLAGLGAGTLGVVGRGLVGRGLVGRDLAGRDLVGRVLVGIGLGDGLGTAAGCCKPV
jgi:hypothetical protein